MTANFRPTANTTSESLSKPAEKAFSTASSTGKPSRIVRPGSASATNDSCAWASTSFIFSPRNISGDNRWITDISEDGSGSRPVKATSNIVFRNFKRHGPIPQFQTACRVERQKGLVDLDLIF